MRFSGIYPSIEHFFHYLKKNPDLLTSLSWFEKTCNIYHVISRSPPPPCRWGPSTALPWGPAHPHSGPTPLSSTEWVCDGQKRQRKKEIGKLSCNVIIKLTQLKTVEHCLARYPENPAVQKERIPGGGALTSLSSYQTLMYGCISASSTFILNRSLSKKYRILFLPCFFSIIQEHTYKAFDQPPSLITLRLLFPLTKTNKARF